ncbi:MAG: McrC family protein [Ruminococcus sp.]|nr:McrC family protein [Ruminococcus sp.]
MAKEIITHHIHDWSKIDEKEGFWGRIDLLRPEINFGIHRYNNNLWTSGQVGIGRLYDRNGMSIQDNGKEHILVITSNYGLDPWHMLETVMLDDEYEIYVNELAADKRFLFHIFYDQPLIRLPQNVDSDAEILFALSYVNSCYALCKKGLKKSLIYHEENFTAKLRGKVDVNKNIKHNTTRGRSDKFYCRYVDFTDDIIENRIVKAALVKCKMILKEKFKEEASASGKINYCLNSMRRVKTVKISNTDFNTSNVGGLYSYYKPVIQQARAILSLNFQSHTEQSKGDEKRFIYTVPYTINMETLFEYYARTELKKALKDSKYRVERYSRKYYLQRDIVCAGDVEKGIHLMPFCIPDIVIYENERAVAVIDVKYKMSGRPDRSDSHQLLAYVLLTGADRCGFILPGKKTEVKEMISSGDNYLPLAPHLLRYYELLLGNGNDSGELMKVLH